jgi:mono/diheme cytochrome c family protein
MKHTAILFLAILLLVLGFLGLAVWQYFLPVVEAPAIEKSYSSLGEQIYFTGRGENGRIIPFTYGPAWLRMHGGSCASCHGSDGKGGLPIMMSDEVAPEIRWHALTEEHGESGEEEHPPYNERLVERAITQGLNPAGEPLDYVMPRWQVNEKELDAIIEFLKELD